MSTRPADIEVVIIRSGYASDIDWKTAIEQALNRGRAVVAIDAAGLTTTHTPKGAAA